MSNDIRLAFEHPEARAAATAGDEPLDRISLRDHVVSVEIGAFQAERGTTQRICFNIVVEVRPQGSLLHDDVDKILSYDTITQAIQIELAAERLNLLETLASRIAERVLLEPQAERVFVRIEKLDRGPGALGVEIVRSKTQIELKAVDGPYLADDTPHPTVVFLSNRAIASENLTGWVDQLSAAQMPVIICVGLPDSGTPRSRATPAQRRIDLLAMEQNAWALAGRDTRCVVMGTHTELDWAARNDTISVWAPSKIVLDATDVPPQIEGQPLPLIMWFAKHIEASRLVIVDGDEAADRDLPITHVNLNEPKLL